MRDITPWKWIAGGLFAVLCSGLVGWMVLRGPPGPPEPGRSRDLPVTGPVVVVTPADIAGQAKQTTDWLSSVQGEQWITSIEAQLRSAGVSEMDLVEVRGSVARLASAHVSAASDALGFAAYERFMTEFGARLNPDRAESIADRYRSAVLDHPPRSEWNAWTPREKFAHVWKHAESRGVAWTGVYPVDVSAGVGGWTRTVGDTTPTFASQFSVFDRPASLRDGTPDVERAQRGGIVWVEFAVELGSHPHGPMRVRYRIYLAKDPSTGKWMPIRADTGGAGPSFPILLI